MQLAGHEVVAAECPDRTRLVLHFDDGQALTLIDNSEHYESFQVEEGKRHWVI